MEAIPYLDHTIRRWQIGGATFLAYPEAGARLMHWSLERADGSTRDILHWPELASLDAIDKVRGGNPILFPFCARSFDRGEIGYWRDRTGTRRPMPNHGFARQGRFRLTDIEDYGFTATLEPDETARAAYPFHYEFTVAYRFSERRLTCEFTLQNLGDQPLPWCAGHHFYFAVPWTEQHRRSDYELLLPSGRTARQSADGALIDGPDLARRVSLADPALVDTFHLGLADNTVRFGPADHSESIAVAVGTVTPPDPDATLVTWSVTPDAPSYCVEPWMGPPNAPEHGRGLRHVAPGLVDKFTVEVRIS